MSKVIKIPYSCKLIHYGILFIILFIYVFAFFIGPISSSLILGIILWCYSIFNVRLRSRCVEVVKSLLFIQLIKYWILIIILGLLFNLVYLTLDFTFVNIYITQIFHYIAAIPVLAFLSYKKYTVEDVERSFITIFVIQTLIQFIVASIPSLRTTMFTFNHFNPDSVVGMGDNFRGSALSAATTYHLSLAYGICFIIYVKHYLLKEINIKTVLLGILIFAGIFCAGRSGFVGCLIAIIGYIFLPKKHLKISKIKAFIKLIAISIGLVIFLIILLAICFPKFYEMLNTYILPYAFEFIYNNQNGGKVETASTNRLLEMWNEDFNYIEFFIGSGHFSNSDGSYYMHVDPGILRHLLFFGIIGYIIILFYQYMSIPFMKMKETEKYFCALIYIFIFIMDFKGLTAGGNKFMLFIPLMISYTYLYLPHKRKNENSFYNGIPSQ